MNLCSPTKLWWRRSRSNIVGNGRRSDPCGNVGTETIETNLQEGLLVWLNEGRSEPGVLLAVNTSRHSDAAAKKSWSKFRRGYCHVGGKKGPTIMFAVSGGKQAEKTFWSAGTKCPSNLYTELKAGEQLEAALESVEARRARQASTKETKEKGADAVRPASSTASRLRGR